MEGLKSKNARQRAECLDVMSSIIEGFGKKIPHFELCILILYFIGMNVCLPSPTVCIREIAKQISDRDNAVRNAALNCIVQAYYIVGEKVYKMVGHVSSLNKY